MAQVDFQGLLRELGFTGPQRAAALGSIIGRMAAPSSELATHAWLGERSGLGELLDVNFESLIRRRLRGMCPHEGVLHLRLLAKSAAAFFTTASSSARSAISRLSRAFSSASDCSRSLLVWAYCFLLRQP